MATAIKNTVDVEVKKIEQREEVQLTMTIEEATSLRSVLGATSFKLNEELGLWGVFDALYTLGLPLVPSDARIRRDA